MNVVFESERYPMKKTILFVFLVMLMVPAALLAQDDALAEGQALLEEGDAEAAVEAFSEVLDENPDNVAALIGRARAYAQLGEGQPALVDGKRAVSLAPESSEAYVARGLALLTNGDLEMGVADLQEAVEVDNTNAEAYFVLGEVYSALGEPQQALSNYTEAIENDPKNAEYYATRASLHYALGEFEAALDDYADAIELEPNNPDHYYGRAFVYFDMGEVEKAIEDDDRVIELAPDFPSAYLNRGFHYYSEGDYDNASVDYLSWIELNNTESFDLDPIEKADTLELEMDEGWAYYVPFTAPEAGTLNVEVFSPGGLVDPVVVVLDDQGEPIMVDDDGGMGLSVLIEDYMLPYKGEYTLVISHAGGGSVGDIVADIEIGRNFGNI